MIQRRTSRVVALAGAGLLIGAVPAAATEGPAGHPLPNTLAPVTVPNTLPAPPAVRRALHPRVLRVQLTPKRLRHGRRGQLRLSLADSRSVKVVIERRAGKRYRRARTISASRVGDSVSLTLRSLPAGGAPVSAPARPPPGGRLPLRVGPAGGGGARAPPRRGALGSPPPLAVRR